AQVAAVRALYPRGGRAADAGLRVRDRLEVREQVVNDLGEDLFARSEVRVEGAVGHVGFSGDVDDAGLEVAVLLECRTRAGHELRPRATPSGRRRDVWGRDFAQARHRVSLRSG